MSGDMSATSARESVDRARTHLEAAAEEVVRQINGRAWVALGYGSWDEMRIAEYRGAAVIVPRADRPELVARLRAEGLSQKAIGDTLGVSHQAVGRDLRNVQTDNTEQPAKRTDSLGRERPTTYAPRAQGLPQDTVPRGDGEVRQHQRPAAEGSPGPAVEVAVGSPAPSVSDVPRPSEPVTDFLESDETLQRARYLHEFMKALTRSDDFMEFDAAKLGEISDADLAQTIDDYTTRVRNFAERFHAARPGLKVINGGRR
jgi:hypothetical protein